MRMQELGKHWSQAPDADDGWSANFYSPGPPYARQRSTVSSVDLIPVVEEQWREKGYLPMAELPREMQEYWGELDGAALAQAILRDP